jgi:two-component sensor histidine kinase/PAS domain-containing protein
MKLAGVHERLLPGREFLADGGEMGALTRAYEWERTPLGAPETWPQSLRTTVRLLLTSRHPMFIWWGRDLIQFYNDAYRKTMGPERHPSALGQPGRECWEEIWDIIGPQIDYVMQGKGATWHEDQLVPVTRFGRRENVWWTYGYSPIDDGTGGVGGVLVVCNDVTEQHMAGERLRTMFQQAPGFVAVLQGPKHVFELINDAYSELIAHRDIVGKAVSEALPEVVGQGFVELLDEVLLTGQAFVARGRPVNLTSENGELATRYLDFVYQPIMGAGDAPTGIFVQGHDVTEQKLAIEHKQLLANELNHRVKNTLATVQAIASQTLRGDDAVERARTAFSARLMALSRTQDILTTEQWQGADLAKVISDALEPHAGGEDRFLVQGRRVRLAPRAATAMAMAVHELTTNAAKYGALSNPEGQVEVKWEIRGTDGAETLWLRWNETGGPPVEAPATRGFGSRLIERSLAMELGGEAQVVFAREGVICTIEAPLANILAEAETM